MNKKIIDKLNEWYGKDDYVLLHFWKETDTYYCVIKVNDIISFSRLWIGCFNDKVSMSVDKEIDLKEVI